MEAYLDNAASTAVFPEVRDIMVKAMEADYGNPSSRHSMGIDAEGYITRAAKDVASILKCEPKEIVFTSGGTEANNIAVMGAALANRRAGRHIISTRIEHASVGAPLSRLEDMGFEVTYLPVDSCGQVDADALSDAVREDTILVSVIYVNNEIGAVQDVEKLSFAVKNKNPRTIFHVDAVQAYGKYKLNPRKLNVDLMSVSGHKIHGPKGSGFLYIKDGTKINPIIFGGGQQRGMRSGTENVPAIAGLAKASRIVYDNFDENVKKLCGLSERMTKGLLEMEGVFINGTAGFGEKDLKKKAPHIVSACFDGIKSEVMLNALTDKGVYVSSGSACSSNHPDVSAVLKAIGVDRKLLDCAIRFSFSIFTSYEQIDYALNVIAGLLPTLRRFRQK